MASIKRKAEAEAEAPEERTTPQPQPAQEDKFDESIEELKKQLTSDPKMNHVELNFTELKLRDVRELVRMLRDNVFVTSLSIALQSQVDAEWVLALTALFAVNHTINRLDLSCSGLSRLIGPIASMLSLNHGLTTLHLEHNDIDDQGVLMLASALRSNTTLRFINLRCNEITDKGADILIDMLTKNHTLTDIGLGKNNIACSRKKQQIDHDLFRNHTEQSAAGVEPTV